MSMRDLYLSWIPRRKPAWTPALPVPRPPGGGAAGTVGEETAACRAFRASLTAVWILESSLSRSWSIQAGSAPTAEGPGVLVSWWWAGSAAAFEAFLARRGADMVWSSVGPSDALARLLLLVGCVFGI